MQKINTVYGFPKLRSTEAGWDKFVTGESKNSSEINEGAPAYTAKSRRPVPLVAEARIPYVHY